ncbi:hypothetical protein HYW36_00955 [Candidatus Saccharibacteria bacterium]|nr:hypothetical protein [Candidatus Saccharibacteria bacterium]
MRITLLAFYVSLLFLLSAAVPVIAENENGSSGSSSSSASETQKETAKKEAEAKREAAKKDFEAKREAAKKDYEAKREAAKQEAEGKREAAKNKLEEQKKKLKDDKLKICQEREDKINDSMARIGERGQNKIDLFSAIADRTKSFYVSKSKVLANYDALVAAVEAKKAAAQTAVDTVISTSVTFDCEADDPKGTASEFKTNVKAMHDALKQYRTAVKNLIVGVKSVQSTEGSQ